MISLDETTTKKITIRGKIKKKINVNLSKYVMNSS